MSEEVKLDTVKDKKKSLHDTLTKLETEIAQLQTKKNELIKSLNDYKADLEKEKKEILDDIEDSQTKINAYYNELFYNNSKDENGNAKEAIKTKIQRIATLAESTENKIKSAEEIINEFDEEAFKNFYNKIADREKKYNSYEENLKKLQLETEKQQKINLNIQIDSQKFLQDITDKTLINTFKEQATEKKTSYKWLFGGSVAMACFVGIAGFVLILYKGKIGLEELALLPFIFAYFSLGKQADIHKKLAEEYQHKASLTEYLAGYKKMWELGREDEEYIKLIEEIKKEILKNPNEFISIGKDYPENIKYIAEKSCEAISKINPLNKASNS